MRSNVVDLSTKRKAKLLKKYEACLLSTMEKAGDVIHVSVTSIKTQSDWERNLVHEAFDNLHKKRIELELDFERWTTDCKDGSIDLNFSFEDYVRKNGWCKHYVPVEQWKENELKT